MVHLDRWNIDAWRNKREWKRVSGYLLSTTVIYEMRRSRALSNECGEPKKQGLTEESIKMYNKDLYANV